VQVWLPEADGPVDLTDPAHQALVMQLGARSRREVLRARPPATACPAKVPGPAPAAPAHHIPGHGRVVISKRTARHSRSWTARSSSLLSEHAGRRRSRVWYLP
jgi:hypothetical protein